MKGGKLTLFVLWGVALALAGWTLSQLPVTAALHTLATLPSSQLLLWTLLNIAIIGLLTVRWQLLADLLQLPIGFGRLLLIRQAGAAVSFITPGPQFGGEPLQLYWLYRQGSAGLQVCVLSLLLDRFMELWSNFLVLFVGVLLLVMAGSMLAHWGAILTLLALLLFGLAALVRLLLNQPRWLTQRLEKLAGYWRSNAHLRSIDSDWQAIGSNLHAALTAGRAVLYRAGLLSVAGWAGMLLELWLLLNFAGVHASLQAFVLIAVALRLALLLPLPGGIGTMEAALFWTFQSLGWSTEAAVSVIALMRLRDAVVLASGLLALYFLQRQKFPSL